MRRKLVVLFVGLLAATGLTVTACSGGNTVPDDNNAEAPQYRSTEDDGSTEGVELADNDVPTANGGLQAVGPVATVNGTEIPAEEFNQHPQIQQLQALAGQIDPEQLAQIQSQVQEQVVQELVNMQLLEDAIEEADIDVTEEMIEERLQQFRDEFSALYGDEISFDEAYAQQGMTPEEMNEVVAQTVAMETLLERRGMTMPTDEDIRAVYEEHQDELIQPEMVEARHILIAVEGYEQEDWEEARERADEIHRQLTEEDADFAEMAREHSDDPAAQYGGELGQFARGQTGAGGEFEETAFSLQPTEISEPVRSDFGWHIIQVTDRHEEEAVAFEEVAPQIELQLRSEAFQEALDDLLVEQRGQAQIELHPENLR